MNNNTKVRLHLSKQLVESLSKQILAESKNMSGGVYTQAVKGAKKAVKEAEKPAKDHKVEEGIEDQLPQVAMDLINFVKDNAGYLAGVSGLAGAGIKIAQLLNKDKEAGKKVDKFTGAGSRGRGGF